MAITQRVVKQFVAVSNLGYVTIVAQDDKGDLWVKAIGQDLQSNISHKWQRVEPITIDDTKLPVAYPTPLGLSNAVDLVFNNN